MGVGKVMFMKVNVLVCKTIKPLTPLGGDFIPAGTPVEVLNWDSSSPCKVLCRARVYMYADGTPTDLTEWKGNISTGLIFSTEAENLVYEMYYHYNDEIDIKDL